MLHDILILIVGLLIGQKQINQMMKAMEKYQ